MKRRIFIIIVLCIICILLNIMTCCAWDYRSPAALNAAKRIPEQCEKFTEDTKNKSEKAIIDWNINNIRNGIKIEYIYDTNGIKTMCYVSDTPADTSKKPGEGGGGGHQSGFSGSCPCPGGVTVKQDGCHLVFTCHIGGDHNATATATTPCPQHSVRNFMVSWS